MMHKYNPLLSSLLLAAVLVFLNACVYKLDVQQGNIVTQEMLDKLRPGMSKQQVRFVMGTPLLQSVFDQQRWDYYYSFKPGYGALQKRRISLAFEGDALQSVSGDVSVDLQRPRQETPPLPSDEPLL